MTVARLRNIYEIPRLRLTGSRSRRGRLSLSCSKVLVGITVAKLGYGRPPYKPYDYQVCSRGLLISIIKI